jgi:hypothetical protein
MICTPHPLLYGDEIGKNERGGACSAYVGGERCVHGFGENTLEKETTEETQA